MSRANRGRRPRRVGASVALALHPLAQQLAVAAHRLRPLAGAALRRLFIAAPQLHLPEHALALHFFLQGPQGLVDVVFADEDLHGGGSPSARTITAPSLASRPAGGKRAFAADRLYRRERPPHIWRMALLEIARMGHPILRATAQTVDDPTAPWVRRLAEDMIETMEAAGGTGLAAPQVMEPWRVVVFRVDADRLSGMARDFPVDLTVLVNPVVELVGR